MHKPFSLLHNIVLKNASSAFRVVHKVVIYIFLFGTELNYLPTLGYKKFPEGSWLSFRRMFYSKKTTSFLCFSLFRINRS